MSKMQRDEILTEVFGEHGAQKRLAAKLSRKDDEGNVITLTPQAINGWKRVPPDWVIPMEKATGISRRRLRPDLYPPERKKAKRRAPKRRDNHISL